jgi:endonuclease YncB( thermonuclease family)
MLVWVAFAPSRAGGTEQPVSLRGVVVRALDGETLQVKLRDRVEVVRHIGIRMPTVEVAGPQTSRRLATAAHAALVEGRDVTLQLEVATRGPDGALLAHVIIDGRLVSADLVRQGNAEVATVPPNVRYRQYLRSLQITARGEGAGSWENSDPRLRRPARSGVIASLRTMSFFHVDDDKGWREEPREYFESPETALAAGFTPSFEYALHAEREARGDAVWSATEGLTVPTSSRPPVAPEPASVPRVPKGHIWRGGVFIPIW